MDFIYGITPSKAVGDYVLTIHAYNLCGDKYEETGWIYSGIGRSGKGTLRDLILTSSGDYYWEPNVTILTALKKNGSNASPEMVVLKGKRDVFLLEPESGDEKIMISIWKKIVGNDRLTFRGLYKQEISFKPQFTPIIQCHAKIGLSKFENNLDTKINNVDFPFKYVVKPKLDYEKQINKSLKQNFESDKAYAEQWFNILLRYYYDNGLHTRSDIIRPKEVEDSTQDYFKENNPFGVWLQDWWSIEPANESTRIKAKDMCEYYNKDNGATMTTREFTDKLRDIGYKPVKKGSDVYLYGFKRNVDKEKLLEEEQKKKFEDECRKSMQQQEEFDEIEKKTLPYYFL
jgi:phage/plasmid-associated DNA primase